MLSAAIHLQSLTAGSRTLHARRLLQLPLPSNASIDSDDSGLESEGDTEGRVPPQTQAGLINSLDEMVQHEIQVYLNKHHISRLLMGLTESVLFSKPTNPVAFLLDKLHHDYPEECARATMVRQLKADVKKRVTKMVEARAKRHEELAIEAAVRAASEKTRREIEREVSAKAAVEEAAAWRGMWMESQDGPAVTSPAGSGAQAARFAHQSIAYGDSFQHGQQQQYPHQQAYAYDYSSY